MCVLCVCVWRYCRKLDSFNFWWFLEDVIDSNVVPCNNAAAVLLLLNR